MAISTGLEPVTSSVTGWRSALLNYKTIFCTGATIATPVRSSRKEKDKEMRAKGIYSLHFSNFENLKMNLEPYIVSIVWVLTTTFCGRNKIHLKMNWWDICKSIHNYNF